MGLHGQKVPQTSIFTLASPIVNVREETRIKFRKVVRRIRMTLVYVGAKDTESDNTRWFLLSFCTVFDLILHGSGTCSI